MEPLDISLLFITILFLLMIGRLLYNTIHINYLSNKILLAILILFGFAFIRLLCISAISHYFNITLPFQSYNNSSLFFAFPMLFFLHVKTTLYDQKKFKKKDMLHGLVFLIFIIIFNLPQHALYTYSQNTNTNLLYYNMYFNTKIPLFLSISRIILSVIYIIATYILLSKFFKNKSLSKQVNRVKKWVYTITHTKLILTLFLIGFTTAFRSLYNDAYLAINISKNIVALFLLGISFYIYKNKNILYNIPYYINPKYINNKNLKHQVDLNHIFNTINNTTEKQELYLNHNFNLISLSALVQIKPKLITLAISENGFNNFSAYSNFFKIKKAKTLITKGYLENHSIAALSEEAGFGATNSFYRVFKNSTGLTPSQFAELQKTIEA